MASRRTRRRDARGASAVEFALVATLLFTLLFAVIEFGRALWLYQAVTSASREAARYGISNGTEDVDGNVIPGDAPRFRDCAGIRDAARSRTPDLGLTDAEITVVFVHPDGTTGGCDEPLDNFRNGSRIEVTVARAFDVDLPLVPLVDFTITATDSRSIYNGVDEAPPTAPTP